MALTVAALLAGTSCGGGDDGPTATTAPPTTVAATTTTVVEERYTVQPGDTLTTIAQRFDTTVQAIVEANDIPDPDRIDVGQELVIPAGQR